MKAGLRRGFCCQQRLISSCLWGEGWGQRGGVRGAHSPASCTRGSVCQCEWGPGSKWASVWWGLSIGLGLGVSSRSFEELGQTLVPRQVWAEQG